MKNINDVTVLIKTFIRPADCDKLLNSIRKFYPTVPVVIVNDGDDGRVWEDEYTKTVTMPFDSGISAGRNEGLKHVSTKYFILTDDDWVFTKDTDLQVLKDLLEESDLDLLGGWLTNHRDHQWYVFDRGDNVGLRDKKPGIPHETLDNGVVIVDWTQNYFIAKTQAVLDRPWDNKLKVREHSAFFLKYRDTWRVGWTNKSSIMHQQNHRDLRYKSYRHRKDGDM